MKKLFVGIISCLAFVSASAQAYYQDAENRDMLRTADKPTAATRKEFVLPETVSGFIPVKADLHTHTIYSDGDVTPAARVREAWLDGLDAIAITDHVEYHPADANMVQYLGGMLPEGAGQYLAGKKKEGKPLEDLNLSVKLAENSAGNYGIIVIPGTEVTREPVGIGHYNALFTTDNNKIYDPDPLQALRNAKAQGAIVMHNHPGWRRKSLDHPEFELKAYSEKLIDGIESNNGSEFYPLAVERAREHGLFVASSTDIHSTSFEAYQGRGGRRNMTIIFAKESTPEALKEALENDRTVGYAFGGTLTGQEELLRQLFDSCVKVVPLPGNKVKLVNATSLRFVLRNGDHNPRVLPEMSSIIIGLGKDGVARFTVENMWTGAETHPKVEIRRP